MSLTQQIIAMHRYNLQKTFMGRIELDKTDVTKSKLYSDNYCLDFRLRSLSSEDSKNFIENFKGWIISGYRMFGEDDHIRFNVYIRATGR